MLHTSALYRGLGCSAENLRRDECSDFVDDSRPKSTVVEIAAAFQQDAVDTALAQMLHQLSQIDPACTRFRHIKHRDSQLLQLTNLLIIIRVGAGHNGFRYIRSPADLAVIRNINTVFMFVLIAILLVFMWKKLREALIPFILMILLIAPTAAGQCFEYSFAVHIMLLASIFYLWNPGDFFSGERLYYLFLISGILLAYFDFMTAPTITLTFPLALVCLNEKRTWKSLIFCGVFWGIGYAGMWAGKWLIALISMKSEFFDDLTMHLHLWTAAELPEKSEEISRIETLNKNLRALFNSMEIDIALLVYSVAALLNTTLKRKDLTVVRIDSSLSLFLPGVIGIAWILVLASHSNVHTFFTYRTLAPCVFCMLCALNIGGFSIKRHFKEK